MLAALGWRFEDTDEFFFLPRVCIRKKVSPQSTPFLILWMNNQVWRKVKEMSISLIKLEWRLVFKPQAQGQKIDMISQPHNESTRRLDERQRGPSSHPTSAPNSLDDFISWSVHFHLRKGPLLTFLLRECKDPLENLLMRPLAPLLKERHICTCKCSFIFNCKEF